MSIFLHRLVPAGRLFSRNAADGAGRRRQAKAAPFLALAALLAGSGAAGAQEAREFKLGEGPWDTVSRWKPTAEPPPMPAWVVNTRSAAPRDYQPLTQVRPEKPETRDPEQLDKLKKSLEGAAARNQSRANRDFRAGR